MFGKKIKKVTSGLFVVGILLGSTIPVYAASGSLNVGGGTWDYGTKVAGINKKKVYSNYYHQTKTHKSSCSIGTLFSSSGWVIPGDTSYSSAVGEWSDETHVYYDYE